MAKSGKARSVTIEDQHLGDILSDLAHDGDERLFTYRTEGEERAVTAADVNATIAAVAGPAFCAKDFRTWGGSRVALEARVEGLGTLGSVDAAADALGNTRAVARSSYVHPAVLDASDDEVAEVWSRSRRSAMVSRGDRALLKLLDG